MVPTLSCGPKLSGPGRGLAFPPPNKYANPRLREPTQESRTRASGTTCLSSSKSPAQHLAGLPGARNNCMHTPLSSSATSTCSFSLYQSVRHHPLVTQAKMPMSSRCPSLVTSQSSIVPCPLTLLLSQLRPCPHLSWTCF